MKCENLLLKMFRILKSQKSFIFFLVSLIAANTQGDTSYTPVVTPNVSTLPYVMEDGVKVFHLIAEKFRREFTPGFFVDCWGYNGQTPGPTIEAVEGDRVRILVTNKLSEHTAVHWHGLFLPNGMDGVGGLTQRYIEPGETYQYEFDLVQHGTFMYHPHADEAVQIALGMKGFFVIHPKDPPYKVDRDYAIFLHMWDIPPGTSKPNPNAMSDFNYFSFNSRVYPGISPLLAKKGDKVRIRFANLSMESHPIHIHGVSFKITATEGGDVPETAQVPTTTVNVPPGTVKIIEFSPEYPGDWPMHCHKTHHAMNAMEHHIPNMTDVDQSPMEKKIRKSLPGFMAMGENGMADMQTHSKFMPGPKNTPPMMAGDGPFGQISMGGMFTVLKVRHEISGETDPGWYDHPPGTVAELIENFSKPRKKEFSSSQPTLNDSRSDEHRTDTAAKPINNISKPRKGEVASPAPTLNNPRSYDQLTSAIEKHIENFLKPRKDQYSPVIPPEVKIENSNSRLMETQIKKFPKARPPSSKTQYPKEIKSNGAQNDIPKIVENPRSFLIIDNFDNSQNQNAFGYGTGLYKKEPSHLLASIVEMERKKAQTSVLQLNFQ